MKIQALPLLLISFAPLLLCNCSVTSATRVALDGTKSTFYQGAIGGKGGAIRGQQGTPDYLITGYDNEKSFRDGVIGLVTYGIGHIAGGVIESGQAAKTARHAATTAQQTAAAKSASEAAALKIKADLLKAIPPEGGLSAGQITL